MTTLIEIAKKLHNTLVLYNGAGHVLGWKTEKVDKLLDESKQAIELAEQPAQQTCNCRWEGETQVQQCTLHEAHVDAIHEWAERAKAAEAKLKAQPQQELVAALQRVMARLADLLDEDQFAEIERIVTNAGVTPPAQRKPLTDEYVYEMWDNTYRSWIGGEQFESITRAIEAAHGIKGEQK